ncbi:MAG: SDR family oxidoreductase [Candidatus Staskawiczbacteria bacterium]|nr:SDR family oxidoreductase [Candidatus Staskawiczbacteria bacterium]
MDLKDKTIIITGGARLGQTVAEYLKNKGANLVITYFNDQKEVGPHGVGVQADVSKKEDVERVVEFAKQQFGRVDGLVHMAAIYEKSLWQDLSEKHWDKNMNVIAKSTFLFGKILGDELLKNDGDIKGKMIFFADWSVLTSPYKDYLAYNAAKSAVVGLTKSLAKELAPGVLVNAIAPGPMLRPPDLSDQENEEAMAGTPLKRWGGADEIAKGVCYLFDTDFVTGHILTIDGGRTIA